MNRHRSATTGGTERRPSAQAARAREGAGPSRPTARAEREPVASDPDFMTSLARGLAVIRAFSERDAQLTIAEVARAAGLPRAAARRCLHTLEALGYAGSDGRTFFLR